MHYISTILTLMRWDFSYSLHFRDFPRWILFSENVEGNSIILENVRSDITKTLPPILNHVAMALRVLGEHLIF